MSKVGVDCMRVCSRAGARVLGSRTIPQGVPPAKRSRHELELKCLRPLVPSLTAPPPAIDPEALWSAPANLLQIPLESKEKQRDRLDMFRRGKPAAFVTPVGPVTAGQQQQDGVGPAVAVANAASNQQLQQPAVGGQSNSAAMQQQPGNKPAAAAATPNNPAAAAVKANPAVLATANAASAQLPNAAAGATANALPPPGPSAPGAVGPGAVGGRMSLVVAALNERQHLFKLPDGLASSITSWRCFIGRGGRARLERVDHVTHESIAAMKQEHMAIQKHYQVRGQD